MSAVRTQLARGGTFFTNRAPQIPFRYVDEGQGGTLYFRDPTTANQPPRWSKAERESIPYVGTYSVRTCVGVYFAIDDRRCFLAHINAYRRVGWVGIPGRHVTAKQGEWFTGKVVRMLRHEAAWHDWRPDVARSRILESLIMVCPEPGWEDEEQTGVSPQKEKGVVSEKLTSCYVMEGIKQFLQVEGSLERKDGFVVGHGNGYKELLSFDPNRWRVDNFIHHPELQKYKPIYEPVALGYNWMLELPGYLEAD